MRDDIKVYIASPYRKGWMPTMVRNQIMVANILLDKGFNPFVPLMAHYMEIVHPRTETEWLKMDLVYVKVCDAVLRLRPKDENGVEIPSYGADKECETARENGIPVFESVEELTEYFKEK